MHDAKTIGLRREGAGLPPITAENHWPSPEPKSVAAPVMCVVRTGNPTKAAALVVIAFCQPDANDQIAKIGTISPVIWRSTAPNAIVSADPKIPRDSLPAKTFSPSPLVAPDTAAPRT
mmetsp:Transcript_73136/g.126893  ORF Transcript_73136/g.126893 Transcript_73136/m.126893 type:complete len:118 (+) Transcript_73136:286-639(+)